MNILIIGDKIEVKQVIGIMFIQKYNYKLMLDLKNVYVVGF